MRWNHLGGSATLDALDIYSVGRVSGISIVVGYNINSYGRLSGTFVVIGYSTEDQRLIDDQSH